MDFNPTSLKKWKILTAVLTLACIVFFFISYGYAMEVSETAAEVQNLEEKNKQLLSERQDLRNQIEEMKGDYQQGLQDGYLARNSYPENGSVIVNTPKDRLAPLTLNTKPEGSNAYYIKLVSQDTNLTEFSFFICPGQSIDIDVPLGNYYIYYATGLQWYGDTDLFGDTTSCFKADDLFCFYYQDGYYNGYTLSLYDVAGGNLGYQDVDLDTFRSLG